MLLSLGCVGLIYASANAGLMQVALWAETQRHAYPYRHEDYLRCLEPSLWVGLGHERILLAGPSEAREGLLFERFDEAFTQEKAFQGAQSLGTLADLLLMLEYVEKAHGKSALPRTVVLGITPRYIGGITHGESPLVLAIDRYSVHYRVELNDAGPTLVEKSQWEGLCGGGRALLKMPQRYRTAVCVLARELLPAGVRQSRSGRLLAQYASPYKYHHLPPMSRQAIESWLIDSDSFWSKARAWNPDDDADRVGRQLGRLRELTMDRGIGLFVVNLPEHELNRALTSERYYRSYLDLVRNSLPGVPFLNLRELLTADEFYDAGHATPAGAERLTHRVIAFVRAHQGKRR